jgi:hypothetical protein
MKIRKMVMVMVVAISALSIGAQVFAADQIKTQIKDQKKDGSCK